MRVLLDTNVVLDLLLAREPHVRSAAQIMSLADTGQLRGVLCATTVTTVLYLAERALGAAAARDHMPRLLEMFEVAPVDGGILRSALRTRLADFEDAVLHESALAAGVQGIVTRNLRDFRRATLPVYGPQELLNVVRAVGRQQT